MQNVTPGQVSSVSTAHRVVAFQLHAGPAGLLSVLNICAVGAPVTYTVTSDAYPAGHTLAYTGQVVLDQVPGTTAHVALFGTDYEMVLRGEVEADIKKLAWYRQRL